MEIKILRKGKERFDIYGLLYKYSIRMYLELWGILERDNINIIVETSRTKAIRESFSPDGLAGILKISDSDFLFFIDIKKVGESEGYALENVQIALAHECVHIKQYWNNELENVDGKLFWKGEPVSSLPSQPFEYEAHEYSYKMVSYFVQEYMEFFDIIQDDVMKEVSKSDKMRKKKNS